MNVAAALMSRFSYFIVVMYSRLGRTWQNRAPANVYDHNVAHHAPRNSCPEYLHEFLISRTLFHLLLILMMWHALQWLLELRISFWRFELSDSIMSLCRSTFLVTMDGPESVAQGFILINTRLPSTCLHNIGPSAGRVRWYRFWQPTALDILNN